MAEEEENAETARPAFPAGRVKKIIKLDREINKINSEALLIISRSTELFIKLLAEKSSQVAIEKKRKTVKLDHLRIAVKRHQPMSDFLLDSLPLPSQLPDLTTTERTRSASVHKSVPAGTRRIDNFFQKAS